MSIMSLIADLTKLGLYPKSYTKPWADITFTTNAYTTVQADLQKNLWATTGVNTSTVTLLSAATAGAGAVQLIQKKDSGVGALIVTDGTVSWILRIKGQQIILVSDGANWQSDWRTPIPTIYETTKFYPAFRNLGAPGAAAVTKDLLYALPLEIETDLVVDAIVAYQQAAAVGTVQMKFGIYSRNPANPGKPDGGALLTSATLAAATLGTSGAAVVTSPTGLALALKRGLYWVVSKVGNTGTVPNISVNGSPIGYLCGATSGDKLLGASASRLTAYSAADALANNMPGTFPASTDVVTATAAPALGIKAA